MQTRGALEPLATLESLPAELHSEIFKYLSTVDVEAYTGAMGHLHLPEGTAASLCLEIRATRDIAVLLLRLSSLDEIHPALRDRVVHEALTVLKRAGPQETQDAQDALPRRQLLDACIQASGGFSPRKKARLERDHQAIQLTQAMQTAADPDALDALVSQVPALMPRDQAGALEEALHTIARVPKQDWVPATLSRRCVQSVLVYMDLANALPPRDKARVIHAAFLACHHTHWTLRKLWETAEERLRTQALTLPRELLCSAVPQDFRFGETFEDLMAPLEPAARAQVLDSLLDELPQEGAVRRLVLNGCAALLRQLANDDIPSRFERISSGVAELQAGHDLTPAFTLLAAELTFWNLPQAAIPALFHLLMRDIGRASLPEDARSRLFRMLERRILLAALQDQQHMREALEQARSTS